MLSLGFLLRCLLALLLVAGFSAIGDLRQHGSDSLDISFTPEMDTHPAQADNLWRGHLPFGDVAGQGREWQSQFLGGLASRVAIHMEQVYHQL